MSLFDCLLSSSVTLFLFFFGFICLPLTLFVGVYLYASQWLCLSFAVGQVHVLFTEPEHRNPPTVGRHPFERDLNLLRIRPLPSPSRTLTVREMGVQTEPPSHVEPSFTEQVPRLHGQRYPRQTLLPHPYLTQDYPDSPPGSPMSYQQLKNWALPYDDYYWWPTTLVIVREHSDIRYLFMVTWWTTALMFSVLLLTWWTTAPMFDVLQLAWTAAIRDNSVYKC